MKYKIRKLSKRIYSSNDYELLFPYGMASIHSYLDKDKPVGFSKKQAEAIIEALEETKGDNEMIAVNFSYSPINRKDEVIYQSPVNDSIYKKDWDVVIQSKDNKITVVICDGVNDDLEANVIGSYSAEFILNHVGELRMWASVPSYVLSKEFIFFLQNLIWKYY